MNSRTGIALGVVLYRNPLEELRRLLASLELCRSTPGTPPFQVCWWDNSPEDSLREPLARLAPAPDYHFAGANLGFGAAHNRMMARVFASPDVSHYVCVNPDGVLHPDCRRNWWRRPGAGPGRAWWRPGCSRTSTPSATTR
ncbi:hypothetical protein ACN28S_31060 [Cystobacter fuscus]